MKFNDKIEKYLNLVGGKIDSVKYIVDEFTDPACEILRQGIKIRIYYDGSIQIQHEITGRIKVDNTIDEAINKLSS